MCTTQFPSKASCRVHVSFYKINRAKTRSKKIQNEHAINMHMLQTNEKQGRPAPPPPPPPPPIDRSGLQPTSSIIGRPLHACMLHTISSRLCMASIEACIYNTCVISCEKHLK